MEEGKGLEYFGHFIEHLIEDPHGTWQAVKIAFVLVLFFCIMAVIVRPSINSMVLKPAVEEKIKEPSTTAVVLVCALAIAMIVFAIILFKSVSP